MTRTWKVRFGFGILLFAVFFAPAGGACRIYIDINAPATRKFKIAIPDFQFLNFEHARPELATALPAVISSDLDFSGYFSPMDRGSFLETAGASMDPASIRFRDWTVIGADLLLKGGYACIGRSLEVEIRLFDVFRGQEIFGMRALGDVDRYRYLMHRVGNRIIRALSGHEGFFLTKIAFVGNATGHKEIYLCDYDGHRVRRITADNSIALLPRLSPDGGKLMYNSFREGAGAMLYMRDLATGETRRISGRKGLNTGACWAPGGGKVALTLSVKGNPDVFTIDLDGKIRQRITSHWGIDVSPAFSPDGRRVAFVSNRSGSPQIYIRDLAGGGVERLTFDGKYNTSPVWSRLDRIAFVSMDRGRFDIYTVRPDGTGLRRLTEDQGNNEDPCWSPDGRYLVFSSSREGRYHLFMMTETGQNQKKITSMKGDQTAPSWGP